MIDSAVWRIDVERVRSHFTHLLSMCSKVNARRPPQTQGKIAASFCLSLLLHPQYSRKPRREPHGWAPLPCVWRPRARRSPLRRPGTDGNRWTAAAHVMINLWIHRWVKHMVKSQSLQRERLEQPAFVVIKHECCNMLEWVNNCSLMSADRDNQKSSVWW